MDAPELEEMGAPDVPCARCGHTASEHVIRETEEAGTTHREAFCDRCNELCDFVPDPEAT